MGGQGFVGNEVEVQYALSTARMAAPAARKKAPPLAPSLPLLLTSKPPPMALQTVRPLPTQAASNSQAPSQAKPPTPTGLEVAVEHPQLVAVL